ncbi:universal stress protein [Lysobacter antibioticus]|uniref:universal stress protein n=1 Tax=Lysobacter antibioticus TaxID=84531 RepID=UPI00034821BF|nr:universal stress protein [Lysobacter antibioticus]
MLKDLVVPMTRSAGDADALNLALGLASAHAARVEVLELVDLPLPLAHPFGLMPDMTTDAANEKLRADGERRAQALRQRLAGEPVDTEVRLVEALYVEAPRMAALHAYYADLTVLAGALGDTREAALSHAYFVALLLESGRPVLVVPPRCKAQAPPRRAVVAWQPTREATRAVHDAMPLLLGTEAVDVVVVDTGNGRAAKESGAQIAAHLVRHGVHAELVLREARGATVASTLLDHVGQAHAQLLVAGGYGHSRLREWALGGVTRELSMSAAVPVFYGH